MPTIEQIKRANANAGQHFFCASALRFFKSRVNDQVFSGPGGVFFVTSERYDWDSPRLYTVRQAMPNGHIETPDEFQQYGNMRAAKRAALKASQTVPAKPEVYALAS